MGASAINVFNSSTGAAITYQIKRDNPERVTAETSNIQEGGSMTLYMNDGGSNSIFNDGDSVYPQVNGVGGVDNPFVPNSSEHVIVDLSGNGTVATYFVTGGVDNLSVSLSK